MTREATLSAIGVGLDRPDIRFAVKSLCSDMSKLVWSSKQRLKHKYDKRRMLSAPKRARAQQSKQMFVHHAEYPSLEIQEDAEHVVK